MRVFITIALGWFVFREVFNIIKNGLEKRIPQLVGSIAIFGIGAVALVFVWII